MSFKHLKSSLPSAALAAPVPVPADTKAEFLGGTAPSKALLSGAVKRGRRGTCGGAASRAGPEAACRGGTGAARQRAGAPAPAHGRGLCRAAGKLRVDPLVHPIAVRPKPDGRYEVVSGENRLQAYRDMGHATIPVTVLQLAEDQVEHAAFFANLSTQELSDYERWQGFKREQEATGGSQSELARLVIQGELKQQQAVAHARAVSRAPKPTVSARRILTGRFKFAERRAADSSVRVDFAAERVDIARAIERIDAPLQDMAAEALKDSVRS